MSAVPPGGESALQVHAAHEAESCGFPQKTPLQDRPGRARPAHAAHRRRPVLDSPGGPCYWPGQVARRAWRWAATATEERRPRAAKAALGGPDVMSQLLSTSRAGRHPLTLRRLRALP